MRYDNTFWDFRVEFTAAGHLTFNARSGKHDDLVLALAIAVWRAHGGGNAGWAYFEAMRSRMSDPTASEPRYYVGVDLGQSRDPDTRHGQNSNLGAA